MSIRRPVHKPIKARSLYAKSQILVRKRICIPLNKVQAGTLAAVVPSKTETTLGHRPSTDISSQQTAKLHDQVMPSNSSGRIRANSAKCPSHLMMQTPAKYKWLLSVRRPRILVNHHHDSGMDSLYLHD